MFFCCYIYKTFKSLEIQSNLRRGFHNSSTCILKNIRRNITFQHDFFKTKYTPWSSYGFVGAEYESIELIQNLTELEELPKCDEGKTRRTCIGHNSGTYAINGTIHLEETRHCSQLLTASLKEAFFIMLPIYLTVFQTI